MAIFQAMKLAMDLGLEGRKVFFESDCYNDVYALENRSLLVGSSAFWEHECYKYLAENDQWMLNIIRRNANVTADKVTTLLPSQWGCFCGVWECEDGDESESGDISRSDDGEQYASCCCSYAQRWWGVVTYDCFSRPLYLTVPFVSTGRSYSSEFE